MKMRCVGKPSPTNVGQIQRDHEASWSRFRRALLPGGRLRRTVTSVEGTRRGGISAIVRPEVEVASRLAEVARGLAVLAGDEHLAFDASEIHTTLYAIEDGSSADDDMVRGRLLEVLHAIVPQHERFCIGYDGLSAGSTGVFAQGWPYDERFQGLRRTVHHLTEASGARVPLGSVVGPELRRTAHATLISFVGSIESPASLAQFVQKNRNTRYGATSIRFVELVRYERTGCGIVIDTLAQIPLG